MDIEKPKNFYFALNLDFEYGFGNGFCSSVLCGYVDSDVAGFFILYVSIWGLGALILSFLGSDLVTVASASAATLGNVGPGLSAVGPTQNYAMFSSGEKGLMVLLMWLGRLEIYSIAALFTRAFWRR